MLFKFLSDNNKIQKYENEIVKYNNKLISIIKKMDII